MDAALDLADRRGCSSAGSASAGLPAGEAAAAGAGLESAGGSSAAERVRELEWN